MSREDTQQAVDQALALNPTQFKAHISTALGEKVTKALDAKKEEVASALVKETVPMGSKMPKGEQDFAKAQYPEKSGAKKHPVADEAQFKGKAKAKSAKNKGDEAADDEDVTDDDSAAANMKNAKIDGKAS